MNRDELLALPLVVDLPTAGRALSMGRSLSYDLARRGEFPVPVLRAGCRFRVVTADLIKLLGVEPYAPAPSPDHISWPPRLRAVDARRRVAG